jgi:predicted O-methyltransferase YrrM
MTASTAPRLRASRPSKAAAAAALVEDAPQSRLSINVSPELHRFLRLLAADRGVTISSIVLEAIARYIRDRTEPTP